MKAYINNFYIGHTTNNTIRYQASSGGIGTTITQYLLSQSEYGTSISFVFDKQNCMYTPQLIYSASEINVCGSIYQDINIIEFIQKNLDKIQGGIVISCPPCYVTPLRQILNKRNIKSFIISFSCSGQTSIEGTWCFYKFIGIDKKNITNIQYRGNGWPSGIQIQTKDNHFFKFKNYTDPWKTIHQSWLFRPKRCLYCKRDTSYNSDVSLADPWLKEYLEEDNIGNTLFRINTLTGEEVITRLIESKRIICTESNYDAYAIAQRPNILKEQHLKKRHSTYKIFTLLKNNRYYFQWATSSLKNMNKHNKIISAIYKLSTLKIMFNTYIKKFKKINLRLRSIIISRKFGNCKGGLTIYKRTTIQNHKCIYIGKNVGIGSDSFFYPITEYANIVYNPKIIIGDNTWICKHCSLAAINKIQIGKNVLFAGYVHITDHSHGYEDISQPIAPQKLISKGPVIIEDDCWLGFNCEILSGVHIGKHCIIAARAVVTKDIPPYSIAAGNPAKIVKRYNMDTKQWEKQ